MADQTPDDLETIASSVGASCARDTGYKNKPYPLY